MYVHESPNVRNFSLSPDSMKNKSAPEKQGDESPLSQMVKQYKHSKETLVVLNYLFQIYKQIDQRPLQKRFNYTSSMFLSEV